MNVVLYAPEIPQNTGNIARTCAATGSDLFLIEPLGFSMSDKYYKRAGLDYFGMVNIKVLPTFEALIRLFPEARYHFASTKAPRSYTEVPYGPDDFLVFGCETRGLPESLLEKVLYEALRQQGFPGLEASGKLTGRDDPVQPWMDYLGGKHAAI